MPVHDPSRRRIPAVETVLRQLGETVLPRPLVVEAVRRTLGEMRQSRAVPGLPEIIARVREALALIARSRLQPVINATGVVIHTNLGRSPLGGAELTALKDAARYCNLELDLESGTRGRRGEYLEHGLARLCHAEAATIVNNCAAALVLILRHFTAQRKEVVVSRGELVQIGGGFRIPDILESSGARLREVGTTNQTTLSDYSRALGRETGLILKVHRSNFFMAGFVESPSTRELAALARRRRIPFVEDLGSGALVDTSTLSGLEPEPTPADALRSGADLVCFSGDKLLGGPQAGIIAGRRRLVNAVKRDPFFRALRCDKLILAAMQATVEGYLAGDPASRPPVHELLSADPATLRRRAKSLVNRLAGLPVVARVAGSLARVGGGTLPRSAPPSLAVDIVPETIGPDELARRLRRGTPPVIPVVVRGAVRLDLRSMFPHEDALVARAVSSAVMREPDGSAASSGSMAAVREPARSAEAAPAKTR
jgi:L-seryl-tRNA(Ser) seleniumtransferase